MGNQPSQPKITAQDKAIYQLKRQRDNLKQYQKRINVVIDRQTTLAKQAVQEGKIEKAKIYLRSKKQQQSVISSTYQQLENLESLIGTIEFKLIEKDVVYGLSQGNEVLKRLNSEMSVEKIDRVMDDLEDEKLKVDEVSDLLGSGLTNSEESEVDDELAALELEVTGKTKEENLKSDVKENSHISDNLSAQADAKLHLPDVPTVAPKVGEDALGKGDEKHKEEEEGTKTVHEPIAA